MDSACCSEHANSDAAGWLAFFGRQQNRGIGHVSQHQDPFQLFPTGYRRRNSGGFAAVCAKDQRIQQTIQGKRSSIRGCR
jgi:hypothetical protein